MNVRITCFVIIVSFLSISSSFANGLSLNSIGPKSLGMGGAFVGIADDYTAVYWNPAGIVNLKNPEIALFVTDVIPFSTFKNKDYQVDAKSKTNHYISPNVAGYLPLLQGDLAIGVGAYIPAGLGTEWDGNDLKNLSAMSSYQWKTKIGVYQFSPVIAYQFNKMLSVGAALNISYGMFDLMEYAGKQYNESSTGMGLGGSFGVLLKPLDFLNIGLSFKTENKIKFKGTSTDSAFALLIPGTPPSSDFERDVAWPTWLAAGIALYPIDNLILALDLQYSMWSKTEDTLVTDFKDASWKQNVEKNFVLRMYWKDALQIRFGAQYNLNNDFAIRAGYYYDPAPAPDNTLTILFPSHTYNTVTVGASHKFGNFNIDLGVEYLMGKERDISSSITPEYGIPGNYTTNILAVSLGVCYSFEK